MTKAEGGGSKTVLSAVPSVRTKLYFQAADRILVSPEQLCTLPSVHELKFHSYWLFTVR